VGCFITHYSEMATCFAEDRKLWFGSPSSASFTPWTFSKNSLLIGKTSHQITSDGGNLIAFELALFDVHYMFWKSQAQSMNGRVEYHPNYCYHTRLRATLEDHFKGVKEVDSCADILTPWLWRTFCFCTHTPKGHQEFIKIAKRYGIWKDEGMPLITMERACVT
jgi:hypothetical protein